MTVTTKSLLVIPEVMKQMVEEKLTDFMVFLPIASIDDTLVGRPGDTLTFPAFGYIGDAETILENGEIVPVPLSTTVRQATVAKTGRGVQLTDEAVLSGMGDPMGEGASQIALSIDNKADRDILARLKTVSAVRQYGFSDAFSVDHVADALAIFGEDEAGDKALFINASDKAILRKSDDYIKTTDIGQAMMLKGTVGELFGCYLIISNRITADANGEMWRYIVKPGAVNLIKKRDVMIEPEREAKFQRTNVFGTMHYTTFLYNESKIVALRQFTAVNTITTVISTAGAVANGTLLAVPEVAPVGYKWVYKLSSANVTPDFSTALSGYTDWSDAEIAASTNIKASVALVKTADSKPVKHQNVTLVKGA